MTPVSSVLSVLPFLIFSLPIFTLPSPSLPSLPPLSSSLSPLLLPLPSPSLPPLLSSPHPSPPLPPLSSSPTPLLSPAGAHSLPAGCTGRLESEGYGGMDQCFQSCHLKEQAGSESSTRELIMPWGVHRGQFSI